MTKLVVLETMILDILLQMTRKKYPPEINRQNM